MHHCLFVNILPFWVNHAPDNINGGFFGRIAKDGTPDLYSPKSLVLNARILWTFSAVFRLFGEKIYREAADRAFDYIISHFIDERSCFNAGYWLLNADGSVREATGKMHTYGQGFLLYAFSEYAAATHKSEAYDYADRMFDYLQNHCRYGNKYSERPFDCKDDSKILSMNTHLHIIEPVTNYFRIHQNKTPEDSLINLIEIFLDVIYNEKTHHQKMYFLENGTPLSDKISYGHDIEFSWLLCEAADILLKHSSNKMYASSLYDRCIKCAADTAAAVYQQGIDKSCGALFDEGLPDGSILHKNKIWWVQAEAVVGFYNLWQICGDERYHDAAYDIFDYIDKYIVDHENGEWYSSGIDSAPDAKNKNKANEWKCPYHNSRMAIEIITRINSGKH
jgi:mannobiose 2-epimerase